MPVRIESKGNCSSTDQLDPGLLSAQTQACGNFRKRFEYLLSQKRLIARLKSASVM